MTLWGWFAAIVFFMQLPIPIYWLVVHLFVRVRRVRSAAPLIIGFLLAWPPVTICLLSYRRELFRPDPPPKVAAIAALALVVFETWIFWRVHRDLGTGRLVGKAELSGAGEFARNGIYARIRHPRYAGSFLAILGGCLLARTPAAWIASGAWTALMLAAITMEEKELRKRFGSRYADYCGEVPAFLPWPRRREQHL